MKKQFLNLGKALNRAEQKEINGGLKDPLNELAGDGGGGGKECQCVISVGQAYFGAVNSCDACFTGCADLWRNQLVSSWCYG